MEIRLLVLVMLAYYFGGKQYVTDTANVTNGKFVFSGNKELQGGMYLVVLSESKYFEIIVSEQHFSFSTKLDDLVGAMTFKESKENPPFYEYLNFIQERQKEVTPIQQKLKTAEGIEKENLQNGIYLLIIETNNYISKSKLIIE